jgi:hypothetical protein
MSEVWKPILEWPRYEASSLGRIRHARTQRVRALHWNMRFRGWQLSLEQYVGRGVYRRRTFFVHQLVGLAFLGPCPPAHEVNHKDNDQQHNAADNLEYLTHRGNMEYAARQGRMARGERAPTHKLTEQQVRQIRALYRKGVRGCGAPALGKRFGVAAQSIDAIIQRRHWSWL